MTAYRVAVHRAPLLWSLWVVAALLMLPVVEGWTYLVVIAASALAISAIPGDSETRSTF